MRAAAVKASPIPRPRCLLCGEELGAARDAQGLIAHWRGVAERAERAKGPRSWKPAARLLWLKLGDERTRIATLQGTNALLLRNVEELEAAVDAARAEERSRFNDYLAKEGEATRRMLLRRDRVMGQRRALVRRLVSEVRRLRAAPEPSGRSGEQRRLCDQVRDLVLEQSGLARIPEDALIRGTVELTHTQRHAMATAFRAFASQLTEQAQRAAEAGDAHEARRLELRAQVAAMQVRSLCTLQAVAASTEDASTREHWRPLFAREAAEVERLEAVGRAACSALPLRPWEAPDERVTPAGSPTESTDQPNH